MHFSASDVVAHQKMLLGYANTQRYRKDWPRELEPEDMVQGTILNAITKLPQFNGEHPNSFTSWLVTCFKRHVTTEFRKLKTEKRGHDVTRTFGEFSDESFVRIERFLDAQISTPSSIVRKEESVKRIYEEIENLPERLKTIFICRTIHGQTNGEIAARVGVSKNTVSSDYSEALSILRKALDG